MVNPDDLSNPRFWCAVFFFSMLIFRHRYGDILPLRDFSRLLMVRGYYVCSNVVGP